MLKLSSPSLQKGGRFIAEMATSIGYAMDASAKCMVVAKLPRWHLARATSVHQIIVSP